MTEDKIKWNEKYQTQKYNANPSEIIKKFYHLVKEKKALDLACGIGRNSKFLASKGFYVDAVDISDVALNKIKGYKNINTIEADLDNYSIKENLYGLILCINFLNRNIFEKMKRGLKEDGILIYETFVYSQKNEENMNRNYLLEKNELLRAFLDFNIIYYEEKFILNEKGKKVLKAFLVANKERCFL